MVENIISDSGNAIPNQFVVKINGAIYFQSYDSVVAKYENDVVTLGPMWDFSNTTRKYLYIFLHNYCHQCRMRMNEVKAKIDSGEFLYDENLAYV